MFDEITAAVITIWDDGRHIGECVRAMQVALPGRPVLELEGGLPELITEAARFKGLVVWCQSWFIPEASDWPDRHTAIFSRDEQLAAVSGCGNPDFRAGLGVIYHAANSFAEEGYCECLADGLWTIRTAALNGPSEHPSRHGAEAKWLSCLLLERDWRLRAGPMAGTGRPYVPLHIGRWRGESEVVSRFGSRCEAPLDMVRTFMATAQWPASPAEVSKPDADHVITALWTRVCTAQAGEERRSAFLAASLMPRPHLLRAMQRGDFGCAEEGGELDCLGRIEILPGERPFFERCVLTVATEEYATEVLTLFGDVQRYDPGLGFVVFAADGAAASLSRIAGLTVIPCRLRADASPAVKGAIYSWTRFLDARTVISLELDMVVAGSLAPLFTAAEVCGQERLLLASGQGPQSSDVTVRDLMAHSGADDADLIRVIGRPYNLDFAHSNAGVIAGTRNAWEAVRVALASYAPLSWFWLEGAQQIRWVDEALFNLAAQECGGVVRVGSEWNCAVLSSELGTWLTLERENGRCVAYWRDEPVRILHFVAGSKELIGEVRALLEDITDV